MLTDIVDRPIKGDKIENQQVSFSGFAFLYSEFVQYTISRTREIDKLEDRLADAGFRVGIRLLELISFRDKTPKRQTKLLAVLHKFSDKSFWELFYTKPPTLQKLLDKEGQYMIRCDEDLLVNKYTSTPRHFGDLNPGAFVAGVVQGMLHAAGFPAKVAAHYWGDDSGPLPTTVLLITFDQEVLLREVAKAK